MLSMIWAFFCYKIFHQYDSASLQSIRLHQPFRIEELEFPYSAIIALKRNENEIPSVVQTLHKLIQTNNL